ncbi:MBL fold metallo-hydrolase [Georgenia sp. Z1491]|uniref:MBL fold metallo-hydrolase n=1 Tax=Georgenia sp. Z1491 TaxID=3416707 RepID=UPI003CEDC009
MTHTPTAPPLAGLDRAQAWFEVRELAGNIWLIGEPGHVSCYLVIGAERALLLDSGLGIAPISRVVAGLTDLPVVVLSSHDHLDHRGGNGDLLDPSGPVEVVELLAHPGGRHGAVDPEVLRGYWNAMSYVVARHRDFRRLDDELFFAATDLPRMRDLPDLTGWRVGAVPPTGRVQDGEVIDLGGRRLTVLHTPGHAPDALVLLEESTGTLLSADTVLASAHWLHGDEADTAAFADSLDRLAALDVRRVLPAHNLVHELPGTAVARVATAARAVADGRTCPVPSRDMLGSPALRHEVGGVVVLTGLGA